MTPNASHKVILPDLAGEGLAMTPPLV